MSTEEQRRKWREIYYKNRERILIQQYTCRQHHKEQKNGFNKQYRATHPSSNKERTHAQELAHNYVQRHREKLLMNQCELCDSQDHLHVHHVDYAYPSIVVTLCASCHMWIEKGVFAIVR